MPNTDTVTVYLKLTLFLDQPNVDSELHS